jgi:hypothetical protein
LTVLSIIIRQRPWKPWPIIRAAINLFFSIAIALVAILYYFQDARARFLNTPWLLPMICIIQFIMLILTHIRTDRPPWFFQKGQV